MRRRLRGRARGQNVQIGNGGLMYQASQVFRRQLFAEYVTQAAFVREVVDLVHARAAQIGVHDKHLAADLRGRERKVAHHACLAIARVRARYHQDARPAAVLADEQQRRQRTTERLGRYAGLLLPGRQRDIVRLFAGAQRPVSWFERMRLTRLQSLGNFA